MQYSDKAMALDIGGRMFEALKKANNSQMSFEDFKNVVKQWYLDHGNTYDAKQEAALGGVFKKIDKDNSNMISTDEIRDFLFHTLDSNGDGVWNLTEITDFIHDYARMLHRNMSGNWTHKLK
jgi:Ca2+-binding EF-hand superfamily protein